MAFARGVLINRNFARLWYGQATSTVGDYVFDTTLVLWVATKLAKNEPWAPAAVSGILLTVGVAVLVVGPAAGVFVDRWNRKRTMLRADLVRAGAAGALALVSMLPSSIVPTWLWLVVIYLVVFVVNAVGQFFSPARFATVADVVEGEVDRTRAAGIGQATTALAAIVGPPLAAPVLFTVGLQWGLLANAASYLVSYLAIRSVRVPPDKVAAGRARSEQAAAGPGFLHDLAAGLRFFRGNRFLVALLTAAVITQIGTGSLGALNVFFVTQNLHVSSELYGFIAMAFGTGAVVGSLSAGRVVGWIGARNATWLGLIIAGLLVLTYSRQSVFVAALVVLTLASIPVAMLNTAMAPLLLGATPSQYLGRVVAVFNPVNQLASMLSVALAGWLASTALRGFDATFAGIRFGSIDTIFAVAGVLVALAGVYAYMALPREVAQPVAAEPGTAE